MSARAWRSRRTKHRPMRLRFLNWPKRIFEIRAGVPYTFGLIGEWSPVPRVELARDRRLATAQRRIARRRAAA